MKKIIAASSLLAFSISSYAHVTFSDQGGKLGEPDKYPQYKDILSVSELQISDPKGKAHSKEYFAQDNNFQGIVNANFYVDKKTQALVFKMPNDHLRSELRVQKNFRTDLSDHFYNFSTIVEIINPEEFMKNSTFKINEVTFMQVHNKGTDNKGTNYIPHPLMRIVWNKDKQGQKGHFWAMVKNSALICKGKEGEKNKDKTLCQAGKAYTAYDLGKAPSAEKTQFDIKVGNKHLVIKVNGEQKVNQNIDYWQKQLSYFKAGVYNQFSNGESEAHFYKLVFSESSK